MAFNNLEYQRKYIAKYKQTQFGKLSTKISQIKFKAKFYYGHTDKDMTLITDDFIDLLMYKFNDECACCNSHENISPCLVTRLCDGGQVIIENTLPMCSSCVRSFQARAKSKINFYEWYKSKGYFDSDKYSLILEHLNHITKG